MHKGARFFRCDFQVHTPRDEMWNGVRPTSEVDRTAWAATLVSAARSAGLGAIAITDHHDTAMYPYVRQAAADEQRADGTPVPDSERLVVFPGVELTLPLPCQAIVLFDADLPLQCLDQLPGILGFAPSPASEERAARVEPLQQLKDLNEIAERLDALTYLRGRFIVLPHVQENGHKTLLRAGFNVHYREFRGVGGYVDGTVPSARTGAGKILDGLDANYGSKPLAVFQTSDSRRSDFRQLGQHSTWVKWSRPSAEALRQSCLARQSRISQAEPNLPAIAIARVEITASKFLGRVNLFLSPQYNTLIGGRGTGKSTLLEYVRWALCVPSRGLDDDEDVPDHERRARILIERTLAEVKGAVRVHMIVQGVAHVVERRTSGVDHEIMLKIGDDAFRASNDSEIRRLLPVEAYSQKQLSSIGRTTSDVLAFVLAPISREVAAIEDEIARAADTLRGAFSRLRSVDRATADRERIGGELESFDKQRESVRAQLALLDPEDAAILKSADSYATERFLRDRWRSEIVAAQDAVRTAIASLANSPTPMPTIELPDKLELEAMLDAASAFRALVRVRLQELLESFDTADTLRHFASAEQRLDDGLQSAGVRFNTARERASAHESAIKQLDDLTTKIAAITARKDVLDRETEAGNLVQTEYRAASAALADLMRRRGAVARERCVAIEQSSRQAVRGTVRPAGDIADVLTLLVETVRGARVGRERFESLRKAVEDASDAISEWSTILDELRSLIGFGVDGSHLPSCPALIAAGFSEREMRAIGARLDDDSWIRLRVAVPRDFVSFDYKTREGEYIPFPHASAGQRATALMRVLLAEEGVPLIVDQPEDDLDNKIIHEIASDIWEAKTRRQIVFASHNANLVVNGDADLVVVFDYEVAGEQTSGHVDAEGAIDDAEVRAAIAEVMEGGPDAFRLRRDKYGF